MELIRVLIVGEEEAFRKSIATILEEKKRFQIVNSLNIPEAEKQAQNFQVDLIVLDLITEKEGRAELVKTLKKQCPCSKIIAVISNNELADIAEIIAHGIDSCIPEGLMCTNFVKPVELTCSTGLFILPFLVKNQMLQYNPNLTKKRKVVDMSHLINTKEQIIGELTKREQEVLELMARNYSNKEIGKLLFISEPTVKTHVSSILHKLGQSNRAQAIIFAYKNGLLKDFIV